MKLGNKKLNPWQQERASKLAKSDVDEQALIEAGELPRMTPVQSTLKDEAGNTHKIYWDNVPDTEWQRPCWRHKIYDTKGNLIREFKADTRTHLMAAIVASYDDEMDISTPQEQAYEDWMSSTVFTGGRHFQSWREKLCDSDQQEVAGIWRDKLKEFYGERVNPFTMEQTYKWCLDALLFDRFIDHVANLEDQKNVIDSRYQMLPGSPHGNLRKPDDAARKEQDRINRTKDLGELKRAAIPSLSNPLDSRRERLVGTKPSGSSRKL